MYCKGHECPEQRGHKKCPKLCQASKTALTVAGKLLWVYSTANLRQKNHIGKKIFENAQENNLDSVLQIQI